MFSGSPWLRMAVRTKAAAAARSRVGVSRKSIVWPSLSAARYWKAYFLKLFIVGIYRYRGANRTFALVERQPDAFPFWGPLVFEL
jgi:hypothetical protein